MVYLKIKDFLLELFFPSFCLNCQKLGPLLCENCYHDLKFYFSQNKIEEIESHFEKVYFDNLQIMARFEGSLAKLLKTLKYQNSKNIASILGKMFWRHLTIPSADMITFIPLHPYKLRLRGYNQCQEIALELSKICNIPIKNLLEKTNNNKSQASITNQQERLLRMKNIFEVRRKYKQLVRDKTIILIDDILTTGSTLNAASQTLKNCGAKTIFGLIVASKME